MYCEFIGNHFLHKSKTATSGTIRNVPSLFIDLLNCSTLPSQHAELFSKLAFGVGKYEDMDMAQLDLTTPAGFAAYNALVANDQGKNGEVALAAMKKKIQSSSNLTEWCQKQKTR